MWNWIISNKEWVFSGIGGVLAVALIRIAVSYMNSRRDKREHRTDVSDFPALARKSLAEKKDFELLPISFDIALQQEIPRIKIWLYAINYMKKKIVFDSLVVTNFHFSGGPMIENIDKSGEVSVPPRSSKQVLLSRSLSDSEVRAIERTQTSNPSNASFSIMAKAAAGRRQLKIDTASISIGGWISGIKS